MEALVRSQFEGIAKSSTAAPERRYPVPLPAELQVKVASDPEATQSSVSLVRKRAADTETRVADYRASLVRQLAYQMMNDRFDEMSRKPDAPFLNAGAFGSGLSPSVATFALSASVQDGKIDAGLAALAIEAKRVKEHVEVD